MEAINGRVGERKLVQRPETLEWERQRRKMINDYLNNVDSYFEVIESELKGIKSPATKDSINLMIQTMRKMDFMIKELVQALKYSRTVL